MITIQATIRRMADAALIVAIMSGCQFPYSPQTQPPPGKGQIQVTDSAATGTGHIYAVNIGQQVCNPSVSQNSEYAACMLWLGYNRITVEVPDGLSGYGTTKVEMHDRLTICDTSNTVRWYLMLSDLNQNGEFQCPEWSTHPDYIACLAGIVSDPFSGFAVRLSDKKSLTICNKKLDEFSTPHFWLPDSAVHGGTVTDPDYDSNGFIVKDQIHQFFGTTMFKFVYTLTDIGGTLYYIDYSVSGNPAPVPLPKPEGLESWYCNSPLISPDGGWVAYNCYANSNRGSYYRSYIQRLKPDALPVLIADQASDPHWWVDREDNNHYYIVYTVTEGAYFSELDYLDHQIEQSGDAGATLIRSLKGTWREVPGFIQTLSPEDSRTPDTLIRLPFKGGLSRDGFYLCTAYKYAYMLHLNSK